MHGGRTTVWRPPRRRTWPCARPSRCAAEVSGAACASRSTADPGRPASGGSTDAAAVLSVEPDVRGCVALSAWWRGPAPRMDCVFLRGGIPMATGRGEPCGCGGRGAALVLANPKLPAAPAESTGACARHFKDGARTRAVVRRDEPAAARVAARCTTTESGRGRVTQIARMRRRDGGGALGALMSGSGRRCSGWRARKRGRADSRPAHTRLMGMRGRQNPYRTRDPIVTEWQIECDG